jgi:hypothetical protein
MNDNTTLLTELIVIEELEAKTAPSVSLPIDGNK